MTDLQGSLQGATEPGRGGVSPRGKYLSPVAQAFFAFVRNRRSRINALAERFGGVEHSAGTFRI